MTETPLEKPVPPRLGRRRFAAIGYALRAIKALPTPLRERVLDGTKGSVTSSLPPFPDILRLVEAAGGVPDGKRWQERLLVERPQLRSVRIRDVAVDDVEVRKSESGGRLRTRLYLPPPGASPAQAALVWVHGGAFVIGSLDQQEAHWPAMELAAAGIPVLSVDYRMCLAGVHYPAPQDDVLTAWSWALEHADELGVDTSRLHLGGGSAGGCLVAGAALRLRDTGQPQPASLFLGYPVLQGDLPMGSPEVMAELASVPAPIPDEWVRAMFNNWAGSAPHDDPYVSPGIADHTGLPPTYVLTCGRDTLRRASEPFVERLRETGVPVWHDLFTDSEHAPLDRPSTPDGEEAVRRLIIWLTEGISGMGD